MWASKVTSCACRNPEPTSSNFPGILARRTDTIPTMQRGTLASSCGWIVLGAVFSPVAAQDWTRFRGPNGSGLSDASTVPTSWTEQDLNWKVALPGPGISQPVLWGERIFVFSAAADASERFLECRRAKDGSVEWARRFPCALHSKHDRNTFATVTPVVDAERIYLILSVPESAQLLALDHGGKEVWRHDLGPHVSRHAGGASPILFEGLVVIANELDEKSFVATVEQKTGTRRWTTERKSTTASYATPCVFQDASGKPELVFSSNAHGLYSLDVRTGAVNWEAAVFDKRTVSSPVIASGLLVATCGSGNGGNYIVAMKAGGKGDVTATHLAFKLNNSIPYVPTPVARGDLLFLWNDKGIVSCVETPTGSTLWQERVGGGYSGSPVMIGDRLYAMSEEGEVPVVAASREFKVLARNSLGEGSRSTPAVSGGRMYLRTYTHLISIGGEEMRRAGGSSE